VIESGSYPGALLRNDTYTYCLIHTQLRQILIAAGKGAGLGRLWSTREAQAMLTLQEMHPNVFTRSVCDVLHGLGQKGLGRLAQNNGSYPAAQRHTILGFQSYEGLQKLRPRATGGLLTPNAAVAGMFASIVHKLRKSGDPERILVYMTIDFTAGNGGEAGFQSVQHLVDGMMENRIVGGASKADGGAAVLTADDMRRLGKDLSSVEASTGFETLILHTGDKSLPGGFLAGLVPVSSETADILENLIRHWRALLMREKIELVAVGADFGSANRSAVESIAKGAPLALPSVPVWESGLMPSVEEMCSPDWNLLPLTFIPDLTEHVFKHLVYCGYEYELCFGPNPRDRVRWSDLIYKFLGAKPIGNRWICSRPGDIENCVVRDVSGNDVALAAVLHSGRAEAWHRELCEKIGVQHLSVRDPQATAPARDLAECWELLAEVGELTASTVLRSALALYEASVGRVMGKEATCAECLAAAAAAVEILTALQETTLEKGIH